MKNNSIVHGFGRCMIMLLVFIIPKTSISQQPQSSVKLFDNESKSAIRGAIFKYGKQSGRSDGNGIVTLNYEQNKTLYLSHTSYGQWSMSDTQVQEAITKGLIYKEPEVFSLLPVTILEVRNKTNEKRVLTVEKPDGLSHDAGQFLSQLPEFSGIRKSGSYGYDPVLRGFKYDQLNIVIDGAQSAAAACPNRMDPPISQVALNMIEQVEILKGPYSLRYGNSFGGVINFTSQPAVFSEQYLVKGRISGGYESNGNVARSEGMVDLSDKALNLKLFGSYAKGYDYCDGDGEMVPANFLRGSFGSNLGIKLNEKQVVSLSATRNFARDTEFPALGMDLISDDTWLLNGRHTYNLSRKNLKSWNTTFYTSLVDHLMNNSLRIASPRSMDMETPAKTQTYGARTEGYYKFNNNRFYLGADFKQSRAQGNRTREFLTGVNAGKVIVDKAWQDGQVTNTGFFGEYQLPLGYLTLSLSGRIDFNSASASDLSADYIKLYPQTTIKQVNPGISAGAIRSFGKGFSASLWLGRVQRSGSLSERYINYLAIGLDPYEVVGDPQIKPEINNQMDLIFEYKSRNTTINTTLFGAYLQNLISAEIVPGLTPKLVTSPGVRQVMNIAEAMKSGFEISWTQKLGFGLQNRLGIAYTYGQNLVLNEPLPEIAPLDFRYILSGLYLNNTIRPEIQLRHVLEQNRISKDFGEIKSPSFTVVDVNIKYTLSKAFNLSLGVNNLLDEAYFEHLNRSIAGTAKRPIFSPGRNFFAMLTINF
jgi:iron complex outermembrane receptor protein